MTDTATKDLYDIGTAPPVGVVPAKMHAYLVREERFGEPKDGFQSEVVPVPTIADDEVLLYVMAAGVNYNNVWASLGIPVNVIKARNKQGEPEDFHIGGSDASGIVYKVGKDVTNVKVGDEVVVHCGMWDRNCPWVKAGNDPMYSPSFRIWGYESNYGSFAQFTKVQAHQCMPKPKHMTWEEAAAYVLVGATAYRMLMGWDEHKLAKDDVTLIWGGAGGLGSMAIQIAKAVGAVPIAVISGDDKVAYCERLGAKGCINRRNFDHWGMLPHWKDNAGYARWLKGVRAFGAAIWEVLGEKKSPRIIFEHPGEATIPTSMFVCDTGGMIVICAGTSGYNATVDLRYVWMRQKRVQGSHFANDDQAYAFNKMVLAGKIDACMSRAFTYAELPLAHQLMHENKHPHGNMAVLIGAPDFGLGRSAEIPTVHAVDMLPADDSHSVQEPARPHVVPTGDSPEALEEMPEVVAIDETTTVGDLMTSRIVACSPADSLRTAASLMVEHGVHAVAVVEDGQVTGVVSHTDVILARQGRSPDTALSVPVRGVMTLGAVICTADTLLTEAISMMTARRIHRLVVVEERDGRNVPIGVLSTSDIVRNLLAESAG
ncbi:MAG: crotonyl-CoA carboxylase/reductase [Rhodospirillaceae bacterium]|nr:crotonyl-CoA carboxylase/reductase [Rhodospirillaceae bacterium]